MMRRGFSIVELAIVIAMIGILSLLLFAGLRNSQIQARDDERQAKAQLIANSLEALYKSGNSNRSYPSGQYPSVATLNNAITGGYATDLLPSIDDAALDFSWADSPSIKLKTVIGSSELVLSSETEKMTFIEPRVGIDEFVYEPLLYNPSASALDNDKWVHCRTTSQKCRRFNLYYRSEVDNSIKIVRSTNQ